MDLCDQFRLPLVNFVDQPGFVIGTEAERRGTIRRGTRAMFVDLPGDGAGGVDPACARCSAWPARRTATTRA